MRSPKPDKNTENKYTHAVVHRILVPDANGFPKETDQLEYCVSIDHAMAIAHQGLAIGWRDIAVIELNEPSGKKP
jgi:hypothetical protein